MNRKTIIQIVVIVVCFGGAAMVLYNGLFKNSGPASQNLNINPFVKGNGPLSASSTPVEGNPLPFGDNLTDELRRVLSRNNLQYGLFSYPKVTSGEAGISPADLVKPLPPPEPQK